MDTSSIFGIVKGILGVLIPPLQKKYFNQPKLYLSFKYHSGVRRNIGISLKNDRSLPVNRPNTIFFYEIKWDYELSIRNNTECPAYNLRIVLPRSLQIEPRVDSLKPLLGNSVDVYRIQFSETYECTPAEGDIVFKDKYKPLNQLKIILAYTNSKDTKFYTIFRHNRPLENRHSFQRNINDEFGAK